jgi:DNA modification methylase
MSSAAQPGESLVVESLVLKELKPHTRNARIHTKHQIRQIAESIRAFGFTNPILIDSCNRIIAGHGRVEAAKILAMERVPTIRLERLSEEQIRAYIIADNKLAENAGWDRSILAIELQHLIALDCDDFNVTITGFGLPEIDLILEEAKGEPEPEEAIPDADLSRPPVTESGDVWQLGKHSVICGNSLHDDTYRTLLGNRRAAVVFTDPPFNVKIDGHATGNGAIHHREFPMASGEMSEVEFISFLTSSLKLLSRYSRTDCVQFICMDWRHAGDLLAAGKQVYDSLLNVCIWVKNTGGMGSFYRSRHEFVFVFRNGKGTHRNNIQLGQYGRNRTNVWEYPSINSSSKSGDEGNLLALHPTVKPVALVADALLDCSARGDVVLDAFLGSGSTLIAAERTGRICYGIELDPLYVDTAIRRWQRHTGDHAVHVDSGKRFDDIASECLEVARG